MNESNGSIPPYFFRTCPIGNLESIGVSRTWRIQKLNEPSDIRTKLICCACSDSHQIYVSLSADSTSSISCVIEPVGWVQGADKLESSTIRFQDESVSSLQALERQRDESRVNQVRWIRMVWEIIANLGGFRVLFSTNIGVRDMPVAEMLFYGCWSWYNRWPESTCKETRLRLHSTCNRSCDFHDARCLYGQKCYVWLLHAFEQSENRAIFLQSSHDSFRSTDIETLN